MNPVRKRRLITVLFIVVASTVVIGLSVYGLRENINLFYPPSKIVSGEAPRDRTIKAGGCVVPGSFERLDDGLKVKFDVTDGMESVGVRYEGFLPDLFEEGEAAVLEGKVNQAGIFQATEVLAKHDESYMPSEVADTMVTDEGLAKANSEEHTKTCKSVKYDS